MANKENWPPKSEAFPDDRLTPPRSIPATLGMRGWQHVAYKAAPFVLRSPNDKPVLARQRDHSACRQTDSPLRVRKTRENLKASSIYADVSPPCMRAPLQHSPSPVPTPLLSFTSATTLQSAHDGTTAAESEPDHDLSGSTLLPLSQHVIAGSSSLVSPPLDVPGKVVRHKSVSRRVLSRVREGISSRSRSSHGHKALHTDGGLMRRLSGKRKVSSEEQGASCNFEISRISIDSETDDEAYASTSQRSFTDASIATGEILASGVTTVPPQIDPRITKQDPLRLASPRAQSSSPPEEPTPKASVRRCRSVEGPRRGLDQIVTPHIELKTLIDTDAVDVGISKEVWVAVEADVRTRAVPSHASNSTASKGLSQGALDVIIIVDQDTLTHCAITVQQCLVELCSRLDPNADRLAALLASSQLLGPSTLSCVCALVHPLRPPKVSALLERLNLAPSTAQTDLPRGGGEQPIQLALRGLELQDLKKDRVHAFVLSTSPSLLAQAVDQTMQWPVHTCKIGLEISKRPATTVRQASIWTFEVPDEGEVPTQTLDNVFRDIRHKYHVGTISSLRLCYKAMNRARIVEVVGEKASKDLRLGQRCSLFLKICLPRINTAQVAQSGNEQDSLFMELESIVGTLETNFLHVEARYRHTLLPAENVVTVRRICSMRRPKTQSRWSLITSAVAGISSERVNAKIAHFLVTHYAAARALQYLSRWNLTDSPSVQQLYDELQSRMRGSLDEHVSAAPGPAVIMTDTGPSTVDESRSPQAATRSASSGTSHAQSHHPTLPRSASTSTTIASRNISALDTAPAESTSGRNPECSREGTPCDASDTAHQLWHHLRRNSLSSKQMLEIMSSEKLEQLEASDEELKALREKALSNKRSIGAETLRAWKYDDGTTAHPQGAAPWL